MMPPNTMISSLTKESKNVTILVRATHIWQSINSKKKTIINANVIFVDEEGSLISTVIWNNQKSSYFPLLKEGLVYAITKFIVVGAAKEYRPVRRNIALNFYYDTKIVPMPDTDSIPLYQFELTKFEDIPQLLWSVGNFIAVIGMVETIGLVEQTLKGALKMDVRLIDERKQPMIITLWEDKASQFQESLGTSDGSAAFVIITGLLAKKYSSANVILSSGNGTRTYCNIDYKPLNELKAAIMANTGHTIETLPPPTESRLVGATVDALKETTIKDILHTDTPVEGEAIRFLCEATIINVSEDDGWFYASCINCPCGVHFDGEMFTCKSCPNPEKKCKQRYMVNVGVQDCSGKTTFKLFNKEVEQLIGVPAEMLITEIGQDKVGPEIPPLVNNLVGKKCLFEVKLTSYNKPGCDSYTVSRLSEIQATTPNTNNEKLRTSKPCPTAANSGIDNNEEASTSKKQRIL